MTSDPELTERGITATPTGASIRVFVSPRASANAIIGMHAGEVKVSLTAPPVEGAANKALVEFMAKKLGVPKSFVRIVSGESSRHKLVGVDGLDAPIVLQKLGLI